MNDDPVEKIRELVKTFGGSFPTTGQGLVNLIRQLENCSALPAPLAVHAGRWAVRTIGAILRVFDGHPVQLVTFCGLGHIRVRDAVAMVEARGYWEGETTPKTLREYLRQITAGVHPEEAARILRISQNDQVALEYLLETRQHWHNTIVDRVFFVRANGGGWWKTARELGTFKPAVVNSWIRAYEWLEKTGDYPQVEPMIVIPDAIT